MAQPPERNTIRGEAERGPAGQALERCLELERAVESLRIRYEQFFLGLTRRPPLEDHNFLRSAVLQLHAGHIRNTGVRFRVDSLRNRFLSYERLWQRTLREIEEGTYRRDLFKARLRRKEPDPVEDRRAAEEIERLRHAVGAGAQASEASRADGVAEGRASDGGSEGAATGPISAAAGATKGGEAAPPSREGPRQQTRAAGSGAAPLDEARMRALYEAYIAARRRCQESTEGITYEALASSLRRQVPEILARHNATAVDFKVVIRGGKAVLKAVPR